MRANVIALTIALGRVMLFPERLQDRLQRYDGGIEYHHHDLGMAGTAGADLFIGRVWRHATGITDRSAVNAFDLPEQPFRTPETAKAQMHLFQIIRKRTHGRRAQNAMRGAVPNWRVTTRQCFSHQWHAGFKRVGKQHLSLLIRVLICSVPSLQRRRTSTPGRTRPSSHSRNAPPAVDT